MKKKGSARGGGNKKKNPGHILSRKRAMFMKKKKKGPLEMESRNWQEGPSFIYQRKKKGGIRPLSLLGKRERDREEEV